MATIENVRTILKNGYFCLLKKELVSIMRDIKLLLTFFTLLVICFLFLAIEPGKAMGDQIIFADSFESSTPLVGWIYPPPSLFTVGVSSNAHTGAQSISIEDDLGVTWGLFTKKISIVPGTYDVSIWVRTDGGQAFLWVEGINSLDQVVWSSRSYAPVDYRLCPLVPDFVLADYVYGTGVWQLLEIRGIAATSNFTYLNLKFGSYFMPGRMYFDDILVNQVQ